MDNVIETTKEVTEELTTLGVTQDVIDRVSSVLNTLADQMGVAADFFWPIFVKQQVVEGLSCFIILFLLTVVSGWFAFSNFKQADFDSNPRSSTWNRQATVFVISAIVSCILAIALAGNLTWNIGHVFNPEYAALHDLITLVK